MKALLVATLAGVLVFSSVAPAAAKGGPAKVDMLTVQTGTVLAGASTWVEISWTASGGDADDFQVTVKNPDPGWEIRYPDNTGSYTSTWSDATLSDGEVDFTAIHVTVPYEAVSDAKLHLEVSYTTDGKKHQQSYLVKVPVAQYSGDDLTQVTTDAGAIGEAGWVEVSFLGNAPRLDDAQMIATPPGSMTVTYPAGKPFTSFAHDARLEAGESDFAAFKLDVSDAEPGAYEIPIQISYSKGTAQGTWTGSVTVTVP